MEHLNTREREVITRRFLDEDKTTLAEIGETFGVTKGVSARSKARRYRN